MASIRLNRMVQIVVVFRALVRVNICFSPKYEENNVRPFIRSNLSFLFRQLLGAGGRWR